MSGAAMSSSSSSSFPDESDVTKYLEVGRWSVSSGFRPSRDLKLSEMGLTYTLTSGGSVSVTLAAARLTGGWMMFSEPPLSLKAFLMVLYCIER